MMEELYAHVCPMCNRSLFLTDEQRPNSVPVINHDKGTFGWVGANGKSYTHTCSK